MDFEKVIRVEQNIAEANAAEYCPCGERSTIGYHGVSCGEIKSYYYCSPTCFSSRKETPDKTDT